jgi:oxaloacetate decarboxylase alpha subunit
MTDVEFVDTTLRDGQQSLWALQMTARMMAPALADIDRAGFRELEFTIPGTQFVRAVRDLHEDPWDWLRQGHRISHTALRFHGGTGSYFAKVPACVGDLLLRYLTQYGMTATRVSNPWNDYARTGAQLARLRAHGVRGIVNVVYSVSPRHTLAYYTDRVRAAVALDPDGLCLKDVGGLLTPEVAQELLPLIVREAGAVPVEFHGHCNNGFGPYVALQAVDAGIHTLHTAIPPLAGGTSLPSIFEVAANLEARGHTPAIDTGPLRAVARHFSHIARREDFAAGGPTAYDEHLYRHQVPGGMMSNLQLHLAQAGLENRLEETLREAARVREDLGFPIMITPLSQFVGTQAALNVMSGGRYEVVSDEIIGYALGRWGAEAITVMDSGVREKILDRPRARELAELVETGDEPSLEEVRAQYGGVDDEELIVRVLTANPNRPLGVVRRPIPETYAEYWGVGAAVGRILASVAQVSGPIAVEVSERGTTLRVQR